MRADQIRVEDEPTIRKDQLWDFYVRNSICEVGFGEAVATRVLDHPHVIVGAFRGDTLVGVARACFDGLSAAVMEFSLDLSLQGETRHRNGSLVERDEGGVGAELARALLGRLRALGCTFVQAAVVDCESDFYRAAGFVENHGHRVMIIDERPY